MSTGSLFEESRGSSPTRTIFIVAAVALFVIVGVLAGAYYLTKPVEVKQEVRKEDELRDLIAAMLSQPRFSGDEFSMQILGKGRLQRLVRNTREVYMSYPQSSEEEFQGFVAKHFADPAKLEFAAEIGGRLVLGDYKMRITNERPYFFRTSLENFRLNTDQTLEFPYKTTKYTISLEESGAFLNNSKVYGGMLAADTSQKVEDRPIVFANHGIMVAKPEEPSLQRLTSAILGEQAATLTREERIQKIVDFVSNEIRYDYTEAVGAGETLKRPNEVLMTRSGDCSNKTILLASLLEQIEEDYLLLYCPKHITVAVPQGAFPLENKMDFDWEGKKWLIAETTLAGFQIGKTRVSSFANLMPVSYVQRPREKNLIFDANSYRALEFR